jgi:hypothetical protein
VQTYIDALKHAAPHLAESLQHVWPNKDERADSERNLTFYLGSELQKDGFHLYFEASYLKDNSRLDMLAVNPATKQVSLCEAKCLFRSPQEQAQEIAEDADRMMGFPVRGSEDQGYELVDHAVRCMVVVAAWREDIRAWWVDEGRGPHPGDQSHGEGWQRLGELLNRPGVMIGAFDGRQPTKEGDDVHHQHILYAIWDMDLRVQLDRSILNQHEQKYLASCIPACVELVLKLLGKVPADYYEQQEAMKGRGDIGFGDFNGKTLFGVTFNNMFCGEGRGPDFPLPLLFSKIDDELAAGRYVIISLNSQGGNWHMWVIYEKIGEEYRSVSRAKDMPNAIEENSVRAEVTRMGGTDILVYGQ